MQTKVGEIEHQTAFGLKRFFVCFDSILEVGMYLCTYEIMKAEMVVHIFSNNPQGTIELLEFLKINVSRLL